MQFRETMFQDGKKKEQLLDLQDSKAAEKHADEMFFKKNDVVSMHCNWSGPEVYIYFSDSRKQDERNVSQRIIYKLELVNSQNK